MQIPEIKARLPLERVLSHYGLRPDRNGHLRCPFHDDRTASLQVFPATGTAYCHAGGCPTTGHSMDAIDFIMHKEACSKHEAIVRAAALAGELPASAAKPVAAPVSANRAAGDAAARRAVLQRVWGYYATALANAPAAREYAAARGLDAAALAAVGTPAGYNSGQLHHGARRDEALIASCVRHGLMAATGTRASTGAPAYRTFGKGVPRVRPAGARRGLGGFYYRSRRDGGPGGGGAKHLYLRERRGLYPRWPPAATRRLLVCESVIDAASVVQSPELLASEWSVLALYGTNGWTAEHTAAVDAIERLGEVCLMLDADTAGRRATALYAKKVRGSWPGARVTSVELPEGADANAVLVEAGAEALARAIAGRGEVITAPTVASAGEAEVFSSTEAAASEMKEPTPVAETVAKPVSTPKEREERGGLDEANPHDLGYGGKAARYRVKGYRLGQSDSLKVTLQIAKP